MPDFDVVVLGGGISGVLIAVDVAQTGRSVALVEAGLVGGESPYLADMPSKSLLQSARRGETWEHAVARRDEIALHLDDTAATARLAEAGVTLIRGTGRISKPGTVEVQPNPVPGRVAGRTPTAVTLRYQDLVLATGSEPVAPPVEGLTDVPAWTSAEALTCPDLPRRLVVLGAGPVGCELAQIYAAFGSQVTLVEAEPYVLPGEAQFTGEILGDALRRTGVDLRLGSPVVKAETLDEGLALTLADGSRIEADRVLLATGRRPRVSGLGLERLGIDASAALPLDETCRVIPGPAGETAAGGNAGKKTGGRVWAAGDVTAVAPYTHTARYQARIVAANILGGNRCADYRAVPRTVYTSPSVMAVGMSPASAAAAGVDLVTTSFDLAETARATVEDDDRGRVELYADAGRDDILVGAAAVGPYAEEWMGEVTLAIRARIPLAVLADVVHAFPTYGEVVGSGLRGLAQRIAAEPGPAEPDRAGLDGIDPAAAAASPQAAGEQDAVPETARAPAAAGQADID
jgi:pyruvate/2-oxoglutarate dehydrogenase complex dihydrolipoamide dehydrogenase (E3) component